MSKSVSEDVNETGDSDLALETMVFVGTMTTKKRPNQGEAAFLSRVTPCR